jgi:hypothetical protein
MGSQYVVAALVRVNFPLAKKVVLCTCCVNKYSDFVDIKECFNFHHL